MKMFTQRGSVTFSDADRIIHGDITHADRHQSARSRLNRSGVFSVAEHPASQRLGQRAGLQQGVERKIPHFDRNADAVGAGGERFSTMSGLIKNFTELFSRKRENSMQDRAEQSRTPEIEEMEEQFNETTNNLYMLLDELHKKKTGND